ncbi:MAG: aminotransferase [Pseudomonadota bacterium]
MTSKTAAIQTQDNRFIHPWDNIRELGGNTRTVAARGDGVYVYDSDGNKLLDGPGGMWCVNIGHGRQEMAQAIYDQVMELPYASPWSVTTGPAAEFSEQLAALAPGDLNHVFFTTCGSTAVDSALRFVQFYNNFRHKPQKKFIIARNKGYHGSTYLSASVSGKERDKNLLDFATDLVHHIPAPHPLFKDPEQSEGEFLDQCVADLENKILELGANNVAVFVAEPILASGGVIVPPEGYHKRCLDVCRKHDVLYLSDEVVTAFGRLGHMFASEEVFGIVPDLITSAKGLTSGYVPMGAVFVSERLIKEFDDEQRNAVFSNGFTYSGHPVAAAAGLKNLEIMQREKLCEHVREVGPYMQEQLQKLRDIPIVTDVRGVGLMGAIECELSEGADDLSADVELGNRIDKHCQAMGLIVRPIINMCVMSPPLTITKAEIDEMVSILRKGVEMAMQDCIDEGIWNSQ